ncbi:MAG: DUF5343 domain-containing protein [Anaerolineae bacterium]
MSTNLPGMTVSAAPPIYTRFKLCYDAGIAANEGAVMSASYPYITAPSYLTQLIAALRSSFPAQLSADILRKMGIAPKNESSTISALRYLGLLDASGSRTRAAETLFSLGDDAAFSAALGELVRKAYRELFEIRGPGAWRLSAEDLATYFSQTDGTSPKVARLQVKTFQILAQAAGQLPAAESPAPRQAAAQARGWRSDKGAAIKVVNGDSPARRRASGGMNLTLHIDLHLPPGADQETYDRIFRAVREQLLKPQD